MTVVRWDPFRNLTTLQTRMNRLFSDTLAHGSEEDSTHAWMPAVDIFERGDDLVLRAELPGVKKDDLELCAEANVLTIRGERSRDETIPEDSYHRVERSYGSFSRSFTLPATVDAGRIVASYNDGVLEVILPKADDAKPKRIEVKVG